MYCKRPIRRRQGIGWYVVIPTSTNHKHESLEGRDIKVFVRVPGGREVEVEAEITENEIRFFFGIDLQPYLGLYHITVYEDKGQPSQNIIDRDYVVELVNSTEKADDFATAEQYLACGNFNKAGHVPSLRLNPPVISATGTSASTGRTVTIVNDSATAEGADILYTSNGSNPAEHGTLYTGAISLVKTATIKAVATKNGKFSDVSEMIVEVTVQEIVGEREYAAPVATGASYGTIPSEGGTASVSGLSFNQSVTRHYTDGSTKTEYATASEKDGATWSFSIKNQKSGATIANGGKVTYNTGNTSETAQKVCDVDIKVSCNGKQSAARTVAVSQAAFVVPAYYGTFLHDSRPNDTTIADIVEANISKSTDKVEVAEVQQHDQGDHSHIYHSSSDQATGKYGIHFFLLPTRYTDLKIQQCFKNAGLPQDEDLQGSYGACNGIQKTIGGHTYNVYAYAARNGGEDVDFAANKK